MIMKKMHIFIAIAALTCLNLLSCVAETEKPEINVPDANEIILEAALVDDIGRTALGSDGSVSWQAEDKISVFSTSGTNACFSLTEGAGSTTAKFAGSISGDVAQAFFPWSESNSAGTRLGFVLPEKQYWNENSFGATAAPMYAGLSGSTLNFRNICGVLKLLLKGADKVGKIVIRDLAGSMLWGNGSLAIDGSLAFTLSDGSDELELDCGDGVQLSSSPVSFYFAVPPGAFASGFAVEVYSDTGTLLDSFSSTKDHSISRSVITPMKAKSVTHDLGLEETANCYRIYYAGNYKFKAVKGNGSESVAAASASVVWESNGSSTAPSSGYIIEGSPTVNDGYIHFSTTGNSGNALIAARDASGNILWSWHIWVPATRVLSARYSNGTGLSVMDRNLGALVAVAGNPLSNGLLYQWGRKDPFPGVAEYSSGNVEQATTGSFSYNATSASKGTDEYAAAHPTEFLYGSSSVISNLDWVAAGNNTHWGASKTIYDPCPPGYRVAPNGIWANLGSEGGVYSGTLDGQHVYPMSGYRWSSNGTLHSANSQGYYWNSTAGTNQAYYGGLYTHSDVFTPARTMARSAGAAVRCCSDNAPEEEENTDEKEFFDALPSDSKVSGISSSGGNITISFDGGQQKSFPAASCAYLNVSDDGYWTVNGSKSSYKYASNPIYRISPVNLHWLSDGSDTGTSAGGISPRAAGDGVLLNCITETARKVSLGFNDGSVLDFEKDIDWGMYVQKTATRMYIYLGHANSDSWIRHDFYYRYKAYTGGTTYPDYYDNWGLGKPCTCTKNGNSFTVGSELFLGGEAEAAVQTWDEGETSQKTYSGGVLHGWENIYTEYGNRMFSLSVDGETVTETGTLSLRQASRIEIEQRTKIARAYSPAGFENAYANIIKRWVIADGTVTIYVEYTFREETEILQAMFGMFCVKRLVTAKDEASGYITNLAWKDNAPNCMYEVTEGWESNVSASSPLKSKDAATTRIEEYGDAGVSFAMQFDGGTLKSKGGFKIGTNGNNYNKIYFDICGGYTAAQYEKLYSTVHWEIDYIKDYDQF